MRARLIATLLLTFVVAGCGDDAKSGKVATSGDPPGAHEPDPTPADPKPNDPHPDGPNPGGPNPFPPAEPDGEALEAPGDDDWASQRNGLLKQGVATTELPAKLELLWKKEVRYGIPASSAIVGDRVYVPSLLGFLYCLDKRSGEEIWKYRSIDNPDPKKFAPGFSAAPTVTQDTVYTGDEDGLVHAINRETGQQKWTFDTRGEVAGGPTVIEESVLVSSHGGGLVRLKATDGDVEWSVGEIGPINLSPPVVDGRTFALGCETGALVTVDVTTGEQLSSTKLNDGPNSDGTALATPAIMEGRMYLGMYDGRVIAIDAKTTEIKWTFKPKRMLEFHASCAVTKDSVFAAGRNKLLHRLDRATGEELWSFVTGAQINCSPVVVGDRVFVASDDKQLYAVSIESGEKVWSYNLEQTPTAGPAVGGGVLVIGTEDSPSGTIFCFGEKQ